ncbi:MAG: GntR family transcriptional regulator [Peptostreptococcaceae bacterium]
MYKEIKKVNKESAVQKALDNLRRYIENSNVKVLPSEDELSKSLGISRLTLREAITILEIEGVVSRVQGKGTMVNSFITKLNNRIDTGSDIEGSLKKHGHNAKFEVISMEYKIASKYERVQMGIDEGEEILVVEKVLYADEKPVSVYIDRIPRRYLKTCEFNFDKDYFKPTIFPIVEKITGFNISHDVIKIKTSVSDEKLSEIFDIEKNTPLITFDVLEYSKDGIVIMYNTEYYTGEFVDFTICRNVAYKYWS